MQLATLHSANNRSTTVRLHEEQWKLAVHAAVLAFQRASLQLQIALQSTFMYAWNAIAATLLTILN
jgi:hypothetical protein